MAMDIRLESLDNGPGLLPFKLGRAKLVTHYHCFLQYVELSDLENRLISIHNQLDYFRTKLDNHTLTLYELQIEYLGSKLIKINSKLKSLEPSRARRGLIDGLGSLIKSVTGNLDHSDAERYNNAIKILESNEHKMLSEFNSHISLNTEWMTQHSILINKIVDNQREINETMDLILNRTVFADNNLFKYAKFAQLLAIISENTEDLYVELSRLENMLTFARASSTHHSMIGIDNLKNIINRLRDIYSHSEIIDEDLRIYYTIIKPGYYFSGKRIVFTFKFPVISQVNFDLFKLSIVPNKFHRTFIPPYPFMATDGKAFMYMEAECPKLNHYHLCEESTNHRPWEHSDCIQSLLTQESMKESCQLTRVTFAREALEQLDDQHYTLVFPNPTKVKLQCDRIEYTTLTGSYLATIPRTCSIRSKEFFVINTGDEVKGQPIKIMEIPKNYNTEDDSNIPHLKIHSINLENLHHIEDKIMLQRPIELKPMKEILYHTTLPFYLFLIIVTAIAIVIAIRLLMKRAKMIHEEAPSKSEMDTNDHLYTAVTKNPEQIPVPATFSLNVLK